ncbi:MULTISPECIES: ATP-binding protein [Pseudoalteromonas]|uniref:ATP-binding protein n=1 Tax=Pseudoalteromonas TaxID=53246 RepID=UPI00272C5DB0|nr:ATP-binding protein [Pseudoalteromonas sp.]
MEVVFKVEHHGMFIEEPIRFSPGINILCGKNGSGKTRLIDAIRKQNITSVSNENGIVNSSSILFISAKDMLNINSGRLLTQQSLDDTYRAIYTAYQQYLTQKEKNQNVKLERDISQDYRGVGVHLDGASFGKFIRKVAENCNKDIDSLTEAEIKSERLPLNSQLNIQNEMSSLCSSYLWLKKDNAYRRYLSENGQDVHVYEFERKHGRAPWVIINEILKDELELDWYLEQSDNLYEDIKPVKFKSSSLNDSEINIQHLSDGEKTILWITCALIKHTLNRNALEDCQLILLDEPDAFLHPKMIHSFISVIRKMSVELGCDVLMSTHSPTTVALAKGCNVYNVTPKMITLVSQDSAIKDLLDGVNFIAVSPENRRTVYVEGYVDRLLYEMLFTCCYENNLLSSDLTVQFIEAAPRTDICYLHNKIKQHWKGASEDEVNMLADEINGQGSCSSVKGQVSAFRSNNDTRVYGIIDRDKNNKPGNGLIVLCDNDFYAIDNVVLNPVSVLFFLFQEFSQEYIFKSVFGELGYSLIDIIQSKDKLSKAILVLCQHIYPQEKPDLVSVKFIDGNSYDFSKVWIDNNGHDFENKLKEKFAFLDIQKFKKEGKLKEHVVKLMCEVYKVNTYPASLLSTFNNIK